MTPRSGACRAPRQRPGHARTLADRSALRRVAGPARRPPGPALSLRVLPAREPRRWSPALVLHPAARAAGAALRLASPTAPAAPPRRAPMPRSPARAGDHADPGGAPHLRRRPRAEVDEVARRYWERGAPYRRPARRRAAGHGLRAASRRLRLRRRSGRRAEARRRFRNLGRRLSGDASGGGERRADLDNLKRKLDAGATRAITHYFFDTDTYLRFLDRCLAAGITAPVVPASCRSRTTPRR